jgi:hypothetical protein
MAAAAGYPPEGGGAAPAAPPVAPAAPADAAAAAEGVRQRSKKKGEPHEVIDELAIETRRTSLLDIVEQQLKGQTVVTRCLFIFPLADDPRIQSALKQEFSNWLETSQRSSVVTGLLVFMQQAGIHFLEGPTQMLYAALAAFHEWAADTPGRQALVGPLRILYFSELHGVRTSRSWIAYNHSAKPMGGAGTSLTQDTCSEIVFICYRKLLLLNMQVSGAVAGGEEGPALQKQLGNAIKKGSELLPSVEEVGLFMSKNAVDLLLTYPEFAKLFVEPTHTVLGSELLWPMPPPLSY